MFLIAPSNKTELSNLYLEQGLPDHTGARRCKASKYYTLAKAAYLLRIPEKLLLDKIKHGQKYHAVKLSDGTIMVHPDAVLSGMKLSAQSHIRKVIRENDELLKRLTEGDKTLQTS